MHEDPKVQEVMRALEAHCQSAPDEMHTYGASAGAFNVASLWPLIVKYGPKAVEFVLTLIPAGTPAARVVPVITALFDALKVQGLISEPGPAA